jgi:RHS repeat-associated protein
VVRHTDKTLIARRWTGCALAGLIAAALLPAQALPAQAASGTARPAPMPVSFPAPMARPASPSARSAPSGRPLDPRFAAPPAAGQGATARTRQADAGYRQAKKPGQPVAPSPDWTPLAPARLPAARSGAAMAYDQAARQVVLFGGVTEAGAASASTWTWDGARWTDLTASLATSPPARSRAQGAYDETDGQVILFGGDAGGSGVLGDTWTWDGRSWTRRTPASSPSPRAAGVMAWDAGLRRVVLYGGRTAGGRAAGDTWTWDGSAWTQLHPAVSPGPLEGATMAADAAQQGLVLFGGTAGATAPRDWTWSFDGVSWKQLAPSARPPARSGAGMVADDALHGVLLTGGVSAAGHELNDTWAWDGGAWRQLAGIAAPAPRQQAGIAYDTATRQVILAGGRRGAAALADASSVALGTPTLTETVDKGANGVYPSGGTVRYTLTIGNSDLLSSLAISVRDQLPASLAVARAPISILDVGTGATIGCDGVVVICSTASDTLGVTGLVIGVLDSLSVSFDLVAVGLDRGCSTATDQAIASGLLGSSAPVSIPVTICDTGLGRQNWWTFVTQGVGPQAQAAVNVANGNLVVQQTDGTPIQAHGHLAYVLARTYNSQDTTLLSFPGSFGAGWNLNVAQTGDLAGLGAGATGLYVPPLSSVLNPLAVTLIDADGTRHVFQFKGLNATIDLTGLLGGLLDNPLGELVPSVLSLDTSKFNHLCVDETFSAPAGVHVGLYRYIEVQSANLVTPCSVPDPGTSPVLLGFAAVTPDRVRYEFSFDGHLLDMKDGSGTDLRYAYQNEPLPGIAIGPLTAIFEPRSCSLPLSATCRALRFSYGAGETDVTDPAGRVTKYLFDATPLTPRLTRVVNPDGSAVGYAYQKNAFSGIDCHGSANQLCAITDPRGNTTSFTYTPPPLIGLDRLATLTDRRGTVTSFTYHTSPDFATADTAGHRQRFQGIDQSGRVGEIDQGDTSDNYPHQTLDTWDTAGATCRQPDAVVDNDLCREVAKSLTAQTPDDDTSFVYNDQGRVLVQHTASPALDTTSGYHDQYFEAGGTVRTFDDAARGSGAVSSTGPSTGRADAATLFAISDRTQSLTPRGNAAGANFAPFLTAELVDDNSAVNPNAIPAAGPCANPAAPTSNTGDVCETDAPSFDGGAQPTVTRSTYDTFGAKLTSTTAKAIAETPAGQPPATYTYTYYQDSDLDLSGSVSAGGWLKGITDPTGGFVAFGYDRAGNVARAWDRNATRGHQLSDFPGTATAPPSTQFTETLYGTGAAALSAPWRYPRSQRDPLGNLTTYAVDANGNRTAIRPPRGNQAGSAAFDTTQTFDQNDEQLTMLLPLETAANLPTAYTYDAFGGRTSTTDPNGNVTTARYDSVERATGTAFTRGPWPSDTSTVPPACRQSSAADAPIPAGRILCSTAATYDGVDNQLTSTDANGQAATTTYDGAHRAVSVSTPRADGTFTALRTDTVYDADGNATDVCSPRLFTEGGATSCTSATAFSEHLTYDAAGRQVSQTTFRTAGGAPDVTTFAYDADGNLVSQTDPNDHTTTTGYDLLDRRISQTAPRDATTSNTTAFDYDPAGNTTAVIQPGSRITAYGYDADNRLVDTVQGADNVSAAAAGLADASGGSNVRTRLLYDADGSVVASFDPRAFATSTQAPDPTFMTRADIDADARTTAVFQPRYDSSAHSDLGLSGTQAAQCPTSPAPQAVPGVPGYPAGVGVCVTRYQYDAGGRHVRTVSPTSNGSDNRFTVYAYTDDGLLASVDAPSPAATSGGRVTAGTYLYDGVGRQVRQTDALGNQQTTTYTADGLVSRQAIQPNGSVTHVTSTAHDASGNPVTVIDALGNKTTTTYFADDLRQTSADPLGDTTRYLYDPAGNLTQTFSPSAVAKDATNSAGTPTAVTYTFDNLPLTSTSPVAPDGSSLRRTTYGYDAGGRKTSETLALVDAQGTVTSDGGSQGFRYFPDDRLAGETGRNGETITNAYDAAGDQVSAADSTSGGSTVGATYYLDGLPRTVDDGTRSTLSTYDGAGRRAAMADQIDGSANRATTTYTYGDAEQALSMSSSIVGGGQTTWTYDAGGRLAHESDPNGEQTTYAFNPDDTLASKALTTSSGTSVASFTYTDNGDFQDTSQTFSGEGNKQGRQTYTYDPAGRLSTFTQDGKPAQSVTWDHDGNRLTLSTVGSATYNADNSLASIADTAGNRHPQIYTTRGDLSGDGCFTRQYDGFDRVTSVTPTGAGGCASTPATSYTYDGLDRQRTASSIALHYDGLSSLVSVETKAGTDTAYELSPSGLASAVAVQTPSPGPAQFLNDDGQGNITTITSAGGALDCSVRYDPWGQPLAAQSAQNPCDTGSTIDDHFYRGQRVDPVTGEYQLGNRAYSPAKASFVSPDTYRIAPPQADLSVDADPLSQNRYSYVNGDPVNLEDPTGHDPAYPACAQANSADCADYYYSGTFQTHNPFMTGRIGNYCQWQYPCIEDWAQPGRAAPPAVRDPGNLWDFFAGILSGLAGFSPPCYIDNFCQKAIASNSDTNSEAFQGGQAVVFLGSFLVPGGEAADAGDVAGVTGADGATAAAGQAADAARGAAGPRPAATAGSAAAASAGETASAGADAASTAGTDARAAAGSSETPAPAAVGRTTEEQAVTTFHAPAAEPRAPPTGVQPTLLGRKADIEAYIATHQDQGFSADFLNILGTMDRGRRGVGGWNWTRNKRFIDDAIASGSEIRLVTDPTRPIYSGGNTYQDELRFLKNDRGYDWRQVDDYWGIFKTRP